MLSADLFRGTTLKSEHLAEVYDDLPGDELAAVERNLEAGFNRRAAAKIVVGTFESDELVMICRIETVRADGTIADRFVILRNADAFDDGDHRVFRKSKTLLFRVYGESPEILQEIVDAAADEEAAEAFDRSRLALEALRDLAVGLS